MDGYPVRFDVDYPDRPLDRVTTFFRLVSGGTWQWSYEGGTAVAAGAGGLLFFGPLLLIVFRQKYPRWWFDWNLALVRFSNRVGAYLGLLDDRYPSTDEEQSVHLEIPYPDAREELNQFLPLVKWFLAIPHYVVLAFLYLAAFFAVLFAWFAILFTGRYPRGLFDSWSGRCAGTTGWWGTPSSW